eukprot:Sdes_comp18176_c0_seq1m7695
MSFDSSSNHLSKPWKQGWWIPTSFSRLNTAEEKIRERIKTAHRKIFVDIGNNTQINTLHFEGSSSKTIPLVFLHGYGSGWGFFYKNIDEIAPHTASIFAIDHPGMGGSSRNFAVKNLNATDTEESFVEALETWRKKMNIEKFVLAGHSFGGYISSIYALKYPERVVKLLLISPVGIPETNSFKTKNLKSYSFFKRTIFHAFKAGWNANLTPQSYIRGLGPCGPKLVRSYVDAKFPNLETQERSIIYDYQYHLLAAPAGSDSAIVNILEFPLVAKKPLIHRLPELKMKTTLVYGSRDWMDVSAGYLVADLMKHGKARVEIIDNAGHNLFFDNPAQFNKLIKDELDNLEE